ncbi:hypothetical protein PR048_029850 [Dryococelus australis]|uniref:Uncharacterized protein n=1 Tax=Dryococelus australis TaxID=614101 RepID=A0ABQ9GB82_9NEOP|nr:hypothetical protein PR048_029850 [Dryococelus australis]
MAMASEYFAHVEKLKCHSNFIALLKAADFYNVVSIEFREGEQDTYWGHKAQRYIVTTIDKCHIQFIMSCDSAKDSSHNKSSLLQNFFNYKIDKVASGLSDLQKLSIKLKSVGHTVGNETMMGKILSSLPDRFRHFLTAWKSAPKSDRTLTNLTARYSTHDNVAFKTINKILFVLSVTMGPHCPELHEKTVTLQNLQKG